MAAVTEAVFPYRMMEEAISVSASASSSTVSSEKEKEWNPSDAVIFVGLSLALGIACRHVLRGTRVPYTVALLILGIALGSIGSLSYHSSPVLLASFPFFIPFWLS